MTQNSLTTKISSERPRLFVSYKQGDYFHKAIEAHKVIEALLGVHERRQAAPLSVVRNPHHPPPDEPKTAAQAHRQRVPRRPTLAGVAKQASKAAIAVARYEVKPDGSVVVVTGKPEQQQGNEVDDWIARHARAPERH